LEESQRRVRRREDGKKISLTSGEALALVGRDIVSAPDARARRPSLGPGRGACGQGRQRTRVKVQLEAGLCAREHTLRTPGLPRNREPSQEGPSVL